MTSNSIPVSIPVDVSGYTPASQDLLFKAVHVAPRVGAVYLNNPKVACTSIKRALQMAEIGPEGGPLPKSAHDRARSPLLSGPKLSPEDWAHWRNAGYVFSIVRHPLTRLQSAYLNKIVTGQKGGQHRMNLGFDRKTLPSYADFLRAILDVPPETQDAHWRPQHINLAVTHVRFDKIGHLETMASDWSEVAAACRLVDPAPREGKQTNKTARSELAAPDGLLQDIIAYYAPDFAHFGYVPEEHRPARAAVLSVAATGQENDSQSGDLAANIRQAAQSARKGA